MAIDLFCFSQMYFDSLSMFLWFSDTVILALHSGLSVILNWFQNIRIAYDTSERFHIYVFHVLLKITTYSSAMYTPHTSSFDVTDYTK